MKTLRSTSIHSPKDEKLTWQSIETLMPSLRPVLLPLLCQLSARRQILHRCLARLPLQSNFQIAHAFRNLVVGFCWRVCDNRIIGVSVLWVCRQKELADPGVEFDFVAIWND